MRTTTADEYLGSPSLTDVSGAKQSKMKIKNQFHSFEMNGSRKMLITHHNSKKVWNIAVAAYRRNFSAAGV